jgi:hypothetical protein
MTFTLVLSLQSIGILTRTMQEMLMIHPRRPTVPRSLFDPPENRPTWQELPPEVRNKATARIAALLIQHMQQPTPVVKGGPADE